MDRPKLTPQIAFNLAKRLYDASGERDARLERVIAQNADRAYRYAESVLKGPWPEAESVIARRCPWAYWYAESVLKGPFPEGESAIARDSMWAEAYIRDVLKTPEDITRFKEVRLITSLSSIRQQIQAKEKELLELRTQEILEAEKSWKKL